MIYCVCENEFLVDLNFVERNVFVDGICFLYVLYFGYFVGVDIRVVFFIFGLGVCGLIVVGNMLWFIKF